MADDELTSEDIDEFLAKTENIYDERDADREDWPCPFCDKVFARESALGSHLETQHGAGDDHIDEVVREVRAHGHLDEQGRSPGSGERPEVATDGGMVEPQPGDVYEGWVESYGLKERGSLSSVTISPPELGGAELHVELKGGWTVPFDPENFRMKVRITVDEVESEHLLGEGWTVVGSDLVILDKEGAGGLGGAAGSGGATASGGTEGGLMGDGDSGDTGPNSGGGGDGGDGGDDGEGGPDWERIKRIGILIGGGIAVLVALAGLWGILSIVWNALGLRAAVAVISLILYALSLIIYKGVREFTERDAELILLPAIAFIGLVGAVIALISGFLPVAGLVISLGLGIGLTVYLHMASSGGDRVERFIVWLPAAAATVYGVLLYAVDSGNFGVFFLDIGIFWGGLALLLVVGVIVVVIYLQGAAQIAALVGGGFLMVVGSVILWFLGIPLWFVAALVGVAAFLFGEGEREVDVRGRSLDVGDVVGGSLEGAWWHYPFSLLFMIVWVWSIISVTLNFLAGNLMAAIGMVVALAGTWYYMVLGEGLSDFATMLHEIGGEMEKAGEGVFGEAVLGIGVIAGGIAGIAFFIDALSGLQPLLMFVSALLLGPIHLFWLFGKGGGDTDDGDDGGADDGGTATSSTDTLTDGGRPRPSGEEHHGTFGSGTEPAGKGVTGEADEAGAAEDDEEHGDEVDEEGGEDDG